MGPDSRVGRTPPHLIGAEAPLNDRVLPGGVLVDVVVVYVQLSTELVEASLEFQAVVRLDVGDAG